MKQPGYGPPPPDALSRYAVMMKNAGEEIIYEPRYDYITYATAGQTSLSFFQEPIGQSSKTDNDTNMTNAGLLPNPQRFLVTSISLDFFGQALPGRDSATVPSNWNDVKEFYEAGVLKFLVGTKHYTTQAPLGKFPSLYRLGGGAALTGETGATTAMAIDYATVCGRPYNIVPVMIPANTNFSVRMEWETAIAITGNTRVGVNLNGYLYRAIQ